MLLKQKLLRKELFGTFWCKLETSWWPGPGLFFFFPYLLGFASSYPRCWILPKQTKKTLWNFPVIPQVLSSGEQTHLGKEYHSLASTVNPVGLGRGDYMLWECRTWPFGGQAGGVAAIWVKHSLRCLFLALLSCPDPCTSSAGTMSVIRFLIATEVVHWRRLFNRKS